MYNVLIIFRIKGSLSKDESPAELNTLHSYLQCWSLSLTPFKAPPNQSNIAQIKMRFFSLFAFATLAFSAVSAAPVPNSDKYVISHLLFCTTHWILSTSGVVARDDVYAFSREFEVLEARGKDNQHKSSQKAAPPPPPKVTFDKSADNRHRPDKTLDKLNLHGDSRKKVEDYHRKVVENHMNTVPGAHTGVVKWVFPLLPSSVFGTIVTIGIQGNSHTRKAQSILTSMLALRFMIRARTSSLLLDVETQQ